jgi:hypothetical protein
MLKDSFETQFEVELDKDYIFIKRKKRANMVLVILLGFLIVLFTYFGIKLSAFLGSSNLYFFLALDLILVAIIWVNVKNHIYPITEVDLKTRKVTKRPIFNFLKEKHFELGTIKGIDFLVKPISGHTSAFEEGNTDYRKRIVLKTQNGEFTLFSFINRSEDLEDTAKSMMEKINYLLKTTSRQLS